MTVGRICQRQVDLAEENESVQEAADRMLQRGVGTLVVVDTAERPRGILTDRDLDWAPLVLPSGPTELYAPSFDRAPDDGTPHRSVDSNPAGPHGIVTPRAERDQHQ